MIDLEKGFGFLPAVVRLIGGEPRGRYTHQGERGDNQRQYRSDSKIHAPIPSAEILLKHYF
jgi:hypothetical protein